jgi:hypothetical protein
MDDDAILKALRRFAPGDLTSNSSYWLTTRPHRRRTHHPLPSAELGSVTSYLRNPTHTGILVGTAKWLPEAGISATIARDFSTKVEQKESEFFIKRGEESISITPQQLSEFNDAIVNKVSFLLYLFNYMLAVESKSTEYWERDEPSYQTVIDLIDTKALRREYETAFAYFRDNLHLAEFVPSIRTNRPHWNKSGMLFILEARKERSELEYFALVRGPVDALFDFLGYLGKIEEPRVRPIFSPEEEVFRPYFQLVRLALPYIINDIRLQPRFSKAIDEYETRRYEAAISAIGLIGEDYLTQIYETLFRDQCPRGQTLGQLFDLIQSEIGRRFKKEPSPPPDIAAVYKTITSAIDRERDSPGVSTIELLTIIRQLVNLIREERACNRESFADLRKSNTSYSVFPSRIRENLHELTRYRNAASHKSRIPLGEFEALRTLHCLFSVAMWWQGELDVIEWSDAPEDIIRAMVARATPAIS